MRRNRGTRGTRGAEKEDTSQEDGVDANVLSFVSKSIGGSIGVVVSGAQDIALSRKGVNFHRSE